MMSIQVTCGSSGGGSKARSRHIIIFNEMQESYRRIEKDLNALFYRISESQKLEEVEEIPKQPNPSLADFLEITPKEISQQTEKILALINSIEGVLF